MANWKTPSLIIITFILLFVAANFALAQRQLEVEYPEIPGAEKPTATATAKDVLSGYIKYLFNFGIIIAGLVAFFSLTYGGFRYLTSAGSPTLMSDAGDQIFSAILGLIILLSSYFILTTLNPQLIILSFSLPEKCDCQKPLEELSEGCQNICAKAKKEGLGEDILIAREIPLGALIDNLLSEEELLRIKLISENTKNTAEKLKSKAEELQKEMEDNCQCQNCEKGSCDSGNCGHTHCFNECYCLGEPNSNSDPCAKARKDIDKEKEELLKLADELSGEYLPTGAKDPGVYLCKKDLCQGEKDKDWKYFPPEGKEISDLKDWNNKAVALSIIGPYDVLLYAAAGFKEQRICFRDSVGKLDDYEIVPKYGILPKNGWAFDVESLLVLNENECQSPGITELGPAISTKEGKIPSDAEEEGVYLCNRDQCEYNWRLITEEMGGIANICGTDPEEGFSKKPKDEMCANRKKDINTSEIGSVGIKGDYGVELYEDINYEGRRICFRDSVGKLDDYEIAPKNGWNLDANSVKIIKKEDCKNPGVTILGPGKPTTGGIKSLEKIKEDLEKRLGELEKAENMIKSCAYSASSRGKAQALLDYYNFWAYKEEAEKGKIVKEIKIEKPWDYLEGDDATTFYCLEMPIAISLMKGLPEELPKYTGLPEEPKSECGSEIPIGKAIDDAETFLGRLIIELGNIINSALNEIAAAENLAKLPEKCNCSNCSSSMAEASGGCCNSYSCNCREVCTGEGENRSCKTQCATCCSYKYCVSCECKCSGQPCPVEEIDNVVTQIKQDFEGIVSFNQTIKDLIDGKGEMEIGEEKIATLNLILEELKTSQWELRKCKNSPEEWLAFQKGEKILKKNLWNCQDVKNQYNFVDREGKEIEECYGFSEEYPQKMENFFCCELEE